jgi:hypothetical protein
MTFILEDYPCITFEVDGAYGLVNLRFYKDGAIVTECELERATGLKLHELIVGMANGAIKVRKFDSSVGMRCDGCHEFKPLGETTLGFQFPPYYRGPIRLCEICNGKLLKFMINLHAKEGE